MTEKKYREIDGRGAEDEELIFQCTCGGRGHELVITYYADDFSDNIMANADPNDFRFKGMQFGMQLEDFDSLWNRLKAGLSYIFKGTQFKMCWVDITEKDTLKIETLFKRYRDIPLQEEPK